jgi:cytochrome P450
MKTASAGDDYGEMPQCPAFQGRAYDPLAPDVACDPEPWLSQARAVQPVFYLADHDVWCVTRYADIVEVLQDTATYSSRYANRFRPMKSARLRHAFPNGHPGQHSMLLKDPPEHSRIRRLANKAFTPRMVATLEPSVRQHCHALVDSFEPVGRCELVSQYSSELPVHTMLAISGAPRTLNDEFTRWGQDYFALTAGAPELTDTQETALTERAHRVMNRSGRHRQHRRTESSTHGCTHGRIGGATQSGRRRVVGPHRGNRIGTELPQAQSRRGDRVGPGIDDADTFGGVVTRSASSSIQLSAVDCGYTAISRPCAQSQR